MEKIEKIETKVAELVENKMMKAMQTTCDKVEASYAKVVKNTINEETESPARAPNDRTKSNNNIETSFRIQGIPEDPNKTRDQNFVPAYEKVSYMMKIIGAEHEIVELRRLGKFDAVKTKPRTLLVTLQSPAAVNLVMAKSAEQRAKLKDMNLFISRALSKEDSIKENLCLNRRKELIEIGKVPRDKLKIKNFELWNDGVKVNLAETLPGTEAPDAAEGS